MDDLRALIEALEKLQQKAVGGDYLFETTFHAEVYEVLDAALAALRATVDQWEAGRDAAEKAVTGLIESNAHDSYTGRLYALNKAREAIRNLTPPEDAP